MKGIKVDFGSKEKILNIPQKNLQRYVSLDITGKNTTETLNEALDSANQDLAQLCQNKKICLLVNDITRREPHKEIAEVLLKRLKGASEILFIICTGSHEPALNMDLLHLFQKVLRQNKLNGEVIIHEAKKDNFKYLGKTKRETEIWVNKRIEDKELVIVAGSMAPHYFAGYSNPLKNFLPGICSMETIHQNHCRLIQSEDSSYGTHPWHIDKKRQKNPIAEDMLEAMQLIVKNKKTFGLVFVMGKKGIAWAKAGDLKDITRAGITIVDEKMSFWLPKIKYLIASPGHEEDKTFYVAQRTLELSKKIVGKETEVLWIAEMKEGIGPPDEFLSLLKANFALVQEQIKQPNAPFAAYKAYRFKKYIQEIKKLYLFSTFLKDKTIEEIGATPINDPQKVIDKWISNSPSSQITVVNKGNSIALYSIP
jgi:nickel-dependent lactate racemase